MEGFFSIAMHLQLLLRAVNLSVRLDHHILIQEHLHQARLQLI